MICLKKAAMPSSSYAALRKDIDPLTCKSSSTFRSIKTNYLTGKASKSTLKLTNSKKQHYP